MHIRDQLTLSQEKLYKVYFVVVKQKEGEGERQHFVPQQNILNSCSICVCVVMAAGLTMTAILLSFLLSSARKKEDTVSTKLPHLGLSSNSKHTAILVKYLFRNLHLLFTSQRNRMQTEVSCHLLPHVYSVTLQMRKVGLSCHRLEAAGN